LGILILGVQSNPSNEYADRQQHPNCYERQRCYYTPKPAFHFAPLSNLLAHATTASSPATIAAPLPPRSQPRPNRCASSISESPPRAAAPKRLRDSVAARDRTWGGLRA